ncbi:MAG: selenide, water dikinase SelD [Deltaproteobacteria bacterium]|nr:selenide, water dikinase SelD [Deltaproteobacteria bacterium]
MDGGSQCHLILVGGGHAHVAVLKSLAMRRAPLLHVTLVSPHSYATYSGMVPGVLAGTYDLTAAQIDIRALAARAGAAFVADRVVRVDAAQRLLELGERPALSYDLVSFDIGSRPTAADRIDAEVPVVLVKPIERAVSGLASTLSTAAPAGGRRIIVVGAGPGGTEIAFALAAHLRREGSGSLTICDSSNAPVASRDAAASRAVQRAFAEHSITFRGNIDVTQVRRDGITLATGEELPADLVVWATGAAGPRLFEESGLPVDARGFLQVGDDLRCGAHPEIFAAGDCATLASHPDLPKAGVYAVRQGPVLTANLRTAAQTWATTTPSSLAGRGARGLGPASATPASKTRRTHLKRFRPQRHFLALLNTGDGRAIFSYRGLAFRGRWAWRLKDRIDRTFIQKYARPQLDPQAMMHGEMIPCGGCAAKVGADVLGRVLSKLNVATDERVQIGVREADDAAVFATPPGALAVATVDAFPPFMDDLYVVGQVAANNAASDLYAMGAAEGVAIAIVCLPRGDARQDEERLEQLLRGALLQLDKLGISLVGGHTIAGEQAIVGFSMHGWVEPDHVLRKSGARPGEVIVLGKPLGTGVILAAARAGVAAAEWTEAAIASMLRSNRRLMQLLREHGVRACTDVTGFGLAGHLDEMLRASGVGARLVRSAVPALPGARELLAAGWRSSFHASNQRTQSNDRLDPLWLDPQTSGGLLAAVPLDRIEPLREACARAGESLYKIGRFTERLGLDVA